MSNDITTIKLEGDFSHPLAKILQSAYDLAIKDVRKLPDDVVKMHGMSGKKYRYFINNLVELTENARYLEIGSHAGSTACAAIWGNTLSAVCIDNWSEFGGPKWQFLNNIGYCTGNHNQNFNNGLIDLSGNNIDFKFIESDFRAVNYSDLGKFNIYFYDGPHDEIDQYDGVELVLPCLDDVCTLIVDDYNAYNIQKGTMDAIKNNNLNVIASITITTTTDGRQNRISHEHSDWHQGYYFAIVSKN